MQVGAMHLRKWMGLVALGAALCAPALAAVPAGLDALAVKDYARARVEFEAVPNDPQAIYQLARMAQRGLGEPVNPARRFSLLQRAAALGHPRSTYEMAWMMGAGTGTTADPQGAVKVLEKADAEGNSDATALLGRVLRFGWWGTPKDEARGVALLKKASDQGNDLGTTFYAAALVRGAGVPADPKTGVALLRTVAAKGVMDAQLELAYVLTFGTAGVDKDEAAGYALYLEVARQGDPYAQYMTCVALMEGRGVAKDVHAGARWCDGAAQQGDGYAQMRLAEMFRSGVGMPRLPSQAYYWLTVAAQGKGSAAITAKDRRARLALELSETEIETQTKRAANFRPQTGVRVRETALPELARGERVDIGGVSFTIPAPKGYFNNWQFAESLNRLSPNDPDLSANLMVLSSQEDMDRFRMGLPGGIRSLEVSRFAEDNANVTPAIFSDIRAKLLEAVGRARAAGRLRIEVVRDDESVFAVVRESLNGGDGIDGRMWIRANGRVLAVMFTGFKIAQMDELRALVPAMASDILAQNGRGPSGAIGSN